jgi:serine/threonine protein kinase
VDDRSVTPVQKLVRLIRSPSAPSATGVRPHNLRPLGADELPRLAQPRLVFNAQSVLVAPALLGEGAYGTVHVVRHTATAAKQYALKQMCKKQLIASSSTHRVVLESQLLEKMNSRFVVDKVASFQTADKIFLVLDLMPGGDIYSLLAALPPGQLDYADLRAVAAHTLLALEHVHSRAVVHRDVKLENLLLAEDCTVKLCDFGLAKTVTTRTFTLCGTPEYMAPEILNSTGYGRGVDYWALGIILYELYSGWCARARSPAAGGGRALALRLGEPPPRGKAVRAPPRISSASLTRHRGPRPRPTRARSRAAARRLRLRATSTSTATSCTPSPSFQPASRRRWPTSSASSSSTTSASGSACSRTASMTLRRTPSSRATTGRRRRACATRGTRRRARLWRAASTSGSAWTWPPRSARRGRRRSAESRTNSSRAFDDARRREASSRAVMYFHGGLTPGEGRSGNAGH